MRATSQITACTKRRPGTERFQGAFGDLRGRESGPSPSVHDGPHCTGEGYTYWMPHRLLFFFTGATMLLFFQ